MQGSTDTSRMTWHAVATAAFVASTVGVAACIATLRRRGGAGGLSGWNPFARRTTEAVLSSEKQQQLSGSSEQPSKNANGTTYVAGDGASDYKKSTVALIDEPSQCLFRPQQVYHLSEAFLVDRLAAERHSYVLVYIPQRRLDVQSWLDELNGSTSLLVPVFYIFTRDTQRVPNVTTSRGVALNLVDDVCIFAVQYSQTTHSWTYSEVYAPALLDTMDQTQFRGAISHATFEVMRELSNQVREEWPVNDMDGGDCDQETHP